MVWDHMFQLGMLTEIACAAWLFNWGYTSYKLVSSSVRHVQLHKDGKTVTFHPMVGSSFSANIKDVKKLEQEKSLVETFEDAFMFPIEV